MNSSTAIKSNAALLGLLLCVQLAGHSESVEVVQAGKAVHLFPSDPGYPGLHQLSDGTFVATTYGVLAAGEKGKAEVARLAEQELSASSFAGVEGCDGVVTLYAPGQIGSMSERLLRNALAHGFAECRSSAVDPGRRSLAIRYRTTP